jgi:hypothetical protein
MLNVKYKYKVVPLVAWFVSLPHELKCLIKDENAETDDLVMDPIQNQVLKCPITSKVIEVAFKNKCGHSYERSAILEYCSGRNRVRK